MKKWIFQLLPLDGRYFLSTVALKQYSPPSYTVEVACRGNIILRQIKQRNTNLLAREFAWFDHKFRPRLRRPYFNSFARDTQSILVLAGMSSAYLISGSIPGTNAEVSRVSHMTSRQNLYACARLSISGLFFRHIFQADRARLHFCVQLVVQLFCFILLVFLTILQFMDNQAQITETTIRFRKGKLIITCVILAKLIFFHKNRVFDFLFSWLLEES